MKVLEINSVCGIRSTGRICTDIAEVLNQGGDTCKIAYGREIVPGKYQKYTHKIGNDLFVRIDGVKTRLFDNAGFNSKIVTKRLISWIDDYNPDIIHLHNLHGYYINVEILFQYLKRIKTPVVWTLHDCWAFTGHCSYFGLTSCTKWRSSCCNCPQKRGYPKSLIFDNSKKNFERKRDLFTALDNLTLVTPSEWLASVVRESFFCKYHVVSIPNGVDLRVFHPTVSDFKKRYGLEKKKIILGVATFWSDSKGLNDFIGLSRLISPDYQIVLVGISPKEAISRGFPSNITCIGRTNDTKVLCEIYSAADVFVNPSRQETMGLVTVEAMACGTPVVVSNYTAVPEVVSENSGIVLDDVCPESIWRAVRSVSEKKYDNILNDANKYEKEQQFSKYISLYKSVLKS